MLPKYKHLEALIERWKSQSYSDPGMHAVHLLLAEEVEKALKLDKRENEVQP